jgi:hypothetical protein
LLKFQDLHMQIKSNWFLMQSGATTKKQHACNYKHA